MTLRRHFHSSSDPDIPNLGLRRENAPPRVSAKFYKAIVQSVLLYGSETWVLSPAVMARLEGFHIRAAYWMAKKHVPRRGQIISGFTHRQRRCWRSVVCTQSSTTWMCEERQLPSMWLGAASLGNAREQTDGAVRCPGGGGGNRG